MTGAIAVNPGFSSLGAQVQRLMEDRISADHSLASTNLASEIRQGIAGNESQKVCKLLSNLIAHASKIQSESFSALSAEEQARILWIHAWASTRVTEFDGTPPEELQSKLGRVLDLFAECGKILALPSPPSLDQAPSVCCHADKSLSLPSVPSWVSDLLAEWALTQSTLAYSQLLAPNRPSTDILANLIDLSCRRNIQALHTPQESGPEPSIATNTVLANARLIRDMISIFPASESHWIQRTQWATHYADVRFIEANLHIEMLATELTDSPMSPLSPDPSSKKLLNKSFVDSTFKKLVPWEKAQGAALLFLGKVMIEAISAIHLEKSTTETLEIDPDNEDYELEKPPVPENDMVIEARQVLIRAAGRYEDAYASFLKLTPKSRQVKEERSILRSLETTYCLLEELDNDTPSVVELRTQRIERAMWINNRLLQIGDSREVEEFDDEDVDNSLDLDAEPDLDELLSRYRRHNI